MAPGQVAASAPVSPSKSADITKVTIRESTHCSAPKTCRVSMHPDENVFTFKPKVNVQSKKIVENLGGDFMTRQQRHIEKQRLFLEQANSPFRHIIQLENKPKKGKLKKHSSAIDAMPPVSNPAWPSPQPQTSLKSAMDDQSLVMEVGTPLPPHALKPLTPANANAPDALVPLPPSESPPLLRRKLTQKQFRDDTINSMIVPESEDDPPEHISHCRSRTMPPVSVSNQNGNKKTNQLNIDRLKNAKQLAEKAIKQKKIFTIQGPYPSLRESLRRRGWVEKFYKMTPHVKKSPRAKRRRQSHAVSDDDNDDDNDDDDDDDDDDDPPDDPNDFGGKVPPWEEENGIYGIMSRVARNVDPTFVWTVKIYNSDQMAAHQIINHYSKASFTTKSRIVRNEDPTFIWGVRRDVIDPKKLLKEQIINHYGKASFTTKVGLLLNMRNLPWFDHVDPDTFFPRCYRLSHDEEKQAFIDDYRFTACVSLLKRIKAANDEAGQRPPSCHDPDAPPSCTNPECTSNQPSDACSHQSTATQSKQLLPPISDSKNKVSLPRISLFVQLTSNDIDETDVLDEIVNDACPACGAKLPRKKEEIPLKWLELSLNQCEKFLTSLTHDDIDDLTDKYTVSDEDWEEFIKCYYKVIHEGATVAGGAEAAEIINRVLDKIRAKSPQFEIDGTKNVWIVKPGAKSRGRGIAIYNKLDEMLKLVSSSVMKKEGKFVVQKYIERPLLVYRTKFDIRQWFMVTDWNPLTLYFYHDCYFRFCSQEFRLDDFDEAIHLSNVAIQKYYENDTARDKHLPKDNIWSNEDFVEYLRKRGCEDVWDSVVSPGMKKAIICSMLCSQDIVEYRKNAFELYGADFMITEDYKPWLIEINSSPTMSPSSKVTQHLCSSVLEDSVKVVLDRKFNKNADLGNWELMYKQQTVTVPPYIGINLSVEGHGIRKPAWANSKKAETINLDLKSSSVKGPLTSGNQLKTQSNSAGFLGNRNQVPATNTMPSNSVMSKSQGTFGTAQRLTKQGAAYNACRRLSQAAQSVSNRLYNHHRTIRKESVSQGHQEKDIEPSCQCFSEGEVTQSSVGTTAPPEEEEEGEERGQEEQEVKADLDEEEEEEEEWKSDSAPTKRPVTPKYTLQTVKNSVQITHQQTLFTKNSTPTILNEKINVSNKTPITPAPSAKGERPTPGPQRNTPVDSSVCLICGNGNNVKLDDLGDRSQCPCQQDSIKVKDVRWNGRLTYPRNALPRPITPSWRPTELPKRITYDSNKLIASVYAKAAQSKTKDGKYVLKYQEPPKPPENQRVPAQAFPKLITRYCSKSSDSPPGDPLVCIDTYQHDSKLSVINQSMQ